MRRLQLREEHWEIMRAHVESCLPLEACGLLAGRGESVHAVFLIRNQLQSPVRFRMEPVEQIRAFAEIESRGTELVGIFHSHPASPYTPSPTDIAEAAYPVVHLVWSHAGDSWEARGYWIDEGRVSEVALDVLKRA